MIQGPNIQNNLLCSCKTAESQRICLDSSCCFQVFCNEGCHLHFGHKSILLSDWLVFKPQFAEFRDSISRLEEEINQVSHKFTMNENKVSQTASKLQQAFKAMVPFFLEQIKFVMEKSLYMLRVNMSRIADSSSLLKQELFLTNDPKQLIFSLIKQKNQTEACSKSTLEEFIAWVEQSEDNIEETFRKKINYVRNEVDILECSLQGANPDVIVQKSHAITMSSLLSSFEEIKESIFHEFSLEGKIQRMRMAEKNKRRRRNLKVPIIHSLNSFNSVSSIDSESLNEKIKSPNLSPKLEQRLLVQKEDSVFQGQKKQETKVITRILPDSNSTKLIDSPEIEENLLDEPHESAFKTKKLGEIPRIKKKEKLFGATEPFSAQNIRTEQFPSSLEIIEFSFQKKDYEDSPLKLISNCPDAKGKNQQAFHYNLPIKQNEESRLPESISSPGPSEEPKKKTLLKTRTCRKNISQVLVKQSPSADITPKRKSILPIQCFRDETGGANHIRKKSKDLVNKEISIGSLIEQEVLLINSNKESCHCSPVKLSNEDSTLSSALLVPSKEPQFDENSEDDLVIGSFESLGNDSSFFGVFSMKEGKIKAKVENVERGPIIRMLVLQKEDQSQQNTRFLSFGSNGSIKLWELHQIGNITIDYCSQLFKGNGAITEVFWTKANPLRFIVANKDAKISIWQMTPNGSEISLQKSQMTNHSAKINCITELTPGSIVSGSSDGWIKLWSLPELKSIKSLENKESVWSCVALSPNCLAVSSNNMRMKIYSVNIWNISKEKIEMNLEGHTSRIMRLILADSFLISVENSSNYAIWKKEEPNKELIDCSLSFFGSASRESKGFNQIKSQKKTRVSQPGIREFKVKKT